MYYDASYSETNDRLEAKKKQTRKMNQQAQCELSLMLSTLDHGVVRLSSDERKIVPKLKRTSFPRTLPSQSSVVVLLKQTYSFCFVVRSSFVCEPKTEPRARIGRPLTSSPPPPPHPIISLLAVPRRLFCFGSLVI